MQFGELVLSNTNTNDRIFKERYHCYRCSVDLVSLLILLKLRYTLYTIIYMNIDIYDSVCSMNINGWEMMIPLAFFAGVGYII